MAAVRSFLRVVDAIAKDLPACSRIGYSHVIEFIGTVLHLLAADAHCGDRLLAYSRPTRRQVDSPSGQAGLVNLRAAEQRAD